LYRANAGRATNAQVRREALAFKLKALFDEGAYDESAYQVMDDFTVQFNHAGRGT
jgi:hypothetical protein